MAFTGGVRNPFMIPGNPVANSASGFRHGSSEQVDRNDGLVGPLRSWLESMHSNTPTPTATPRSSRARSPVDEEDDDRHQDRQERRDNRRRRGTSEQPVGWDFRIRSCESTLRDHQNELAAQRRAINQMTEAFHQYTKDKEETGKTLDWVFEEVATKVREQKEFKKELAERHQGVTRTINALIPAITQQFEQIRAEMQIDKLCLDFAQQIEVMRIEIGRLRNQRPQTVDPPRPPTSWTQEPSSAGPQSSTGTNTQPPNFGGIP